MRAGHPTPSTTLLGSITFFMGYDMRMRVEPRKGPADQIKKTKQQLKTHTKVMARFSSSGVLGQGFAMYEHPTFDALLDKHWELVKAHDALDRPGYFRFNNTGMGVYMRAMDELGMIYDSGDPYMDWESLPDPEEVGEDAYQLASDALTEGDYLMIPAHKFSTNDGWWVTPSEIQGSLAVWDALEPPAPWPELSERSKQVVESDYWHDWISYLRRAVDHDGFRVH